MYIHDLLAKHVVDADFYLCLIAREFDAYSEYFRCCTHKQEPIFLADGVIADKDTLLWTLLLCADRPQGAYGC